MITTPAEDRALFFVRMEKEPDGFIALIGTDVQERAPALAKALDAALAERSSSLRGEEAIGEVLGYLRERGGTHAGPPLQWEGSYFQIGMVVTN